VAAGTDDDLGGEGEKKKKKSKKQHALVRPIICICNDQYAASLRPLRAVAKIFVFDTPAKSKLLERLQHICKREGMAADSRALSALGALSALAFSLLTTRCCRVCAVCCLLSFVCCLLPAV
jgi:DNA polymerase III delta prime subunit